MKKNKKLLVIAVLLLLVTIGFSYAIYRSSTRANGTVNTAAWSVKINGTDMDSANYTFGYSNIHWDANPGKDNTIAPGATGYIDIPVDASGSQVDVILTAALGATTLPSGMTVSLASGSDSQTIAYSATEGQMKANVRINITWTGTVKDATSKDTTDKAANGSEISIPVTLTARQKVVGE